MKVLCSHHDTIVYLAEHVKLLDKFVIKQIKKASPSYQQALLEAKLLQTLRHPCIPFLYHIYEEKEALYLVEQYMEGKSLYSICQSEQLSMTTIISFSIQLCNIVSYLHSLPQPILHLDINPNNIIVSDSKLALIDFSAAIIKTNHALKVSRYGTIGYAAPEQFSEKQLDERTDLYGIGSTMEYMLEQNYSEWEGKSEEYLKLIHIIKKCRRKRRIQRYSRVQQVGSLLSQLYERRVMQKRKKELCIAIAGTQTHIGVTHTALLLGLFLKRQKRQCVYLECNDTKVAKCLIESEYTLSQEAFYEYKGIPIIPASSDIEVSKVWEKGYSYVLKDYGVLTQQNMNQFEKADVKLIVYGSKVYEYPVTLACIHMLSSYQNTYFLENYQTAREDRKFKEMIPKKQNFTLPYVAELMNSNNCEISKLFSQVLMKYL